MFLDNFKERLGKEKFVAASPEDNEVYMDEEVEQLPSFAGGQYQMTVYRNVNGMVVSNVVTKTCGPGSSGLFEFLSNSFVYPPVAEEMGQQGQVIVTFVVERDGSITDVQVKKSVEPSLDKEAIRVVKSMPRWIPGKYKGKPIRVKHKVPITFRLP